MYRDMSQYFCWNNITKEIKEYMGKCLTSENVKAEHQRPVGEMIPLEIPTWMWSISMDFVMVLPPFSYREECYMDNS